MIRKQSQYWSQHVTETSNALDLEPGVFTWSDPQKIALSLKHSADHSQRRKVEPFAAAMAMLNFYINRAGSICLCNNARCWNRSKMSYGYCMENLGMAISCRAWC